MPEPANTERKQGHRFQKGQSGNPAGKAKGTRHYATLLAEKLLADDAADVVRAVLTAARGGDMTAARLVLERICPVRKGRPVTIDLPTVTTSADVLIALGAVVEAVGDGILTPDEGATIAGLIDTKRRAIETVELDARIAALEAGRGKS
ncbi:MAG: hypothetical protein HQL37_16475 [Alphaproteobacteria bacterium]|nr:hypothetical protein [Alphaproteobacteria bacterium]